MHDAAGFARCVDKTLLVNYSGLSSFELRRLLIKVPGSPGIAIASVAPTSVLSSERAL